jgi:ubiquinone/menaquinone biosynthesis C-methylase UbiE
MSSKSITRRFAMALPAVSAAAQQTAPTARPQPSARTPAFVEEFWKPFEANIVALLPIRPGMRILDLGCGAGIHLGLLAERLRGKGEVIGFDLRQDRLDVAKEKFGSNPMVRLRQGDLYKLPFDDNEFDLVWSSHVFHGLPDIDGAARQVRRVLKSAGTAALREDGSTSRFLPLDCGVGKPGFEGRVHQAFMEWFVEDRLARGRYPHGWTHTLETIGLTNVRAQSILHEARPPLTPAQKDYLAYSLRRRLDFEKITDEDKQSALAVTDPASPHYAMSRTDLHFTAVSTLYTGVAGSARMRVV